MAIINILKQLYGLSTGNGSPVGRESNVSKQQSIHIEQGDYIDYYNRVKELAKEKNWKQDKINKMLSDREAFDREYNLVSKQTHFSSKYLFHIYL